MDDDDDNLSKMWERFVLTDEEQASVVLGDDGVQESTRERSDLCVIGKVLTDRPFSAEAAKHTLKQEWKPARGLAIKDLADNNNNNNNLFLFQFFHVADKRRVLANGPWLFEKNLVLLKEIEGHEVPVDVVLKEASFWIQVFNLPLSAMKNVVKFGEEIGNEVGKFVEVAQVTIEEEGKYLRIRVTLDITRPLRRGLLLTIPPRIGKTWAYIKYEHLPNFCFCCGRLGHLEPDCSHHISTTTSDNQYGNWLREGRIHKTTTIMAAVAPGPLRRSWEDLERDCMVEILARVGIESLVFYIPKVCKSWYNASLDPICWRNLTTFPEIEYMYIEPYTLKMLNFKRKHGPSGLTAFIKFVVDRSRRSAVSLQLPSYCSMETYKYVLDRCPALKLLNLPSSLIHDNDDDENNFISKSIIRRRKYWKNLEELIISGGPTLPHTLIRLTFLHCMKMVALSCSFILVGPQEAPVIVELLPKIKNLSITHCCFRRENVVTVLKGCSKENVALEALDISNNCGLFLRDEKDHHHILELLAPESSSHINTFKWENDSSTLWMIQDLHPLKILQVIACVLK